REEELGGGRPLGRELKGAGAPRGPDAGERAAGDPLVKARVVGVGAFGAEHESPSPVAVCGEGTRVVDGSYAGRPRRAPEPGSLELTPCDWGSTVGAWARPLIRGRCSAAWSPRSPTGPRRRCATRPPASATSGTAPPPARPARSSHT